MPDYLHSAPAAWSQSRADVQPHGCVATNALLVFARVYWSAPAAAAFRPLHINYLHIIAHKWAVSERGKWNGEGGQYQCETWPWACVWCTAVVVCLQTVWTVLLGRCHCSRITLGFEKMPAHSRINRGLSDTMDGKRQHCPPPSSEKRDREKKTSSRFPKTSFTKAFLFLCIYYAWYSDVELCQKKKWLKPPR